MAKRPIHVRHEMTAAAAAAANPAVARQIVAATARAARPIVQREVGPGTGGLGASAGDRGDRPAASNIAIVYTGESSVGCPFDSAVICGMGGGMRDHGYDLLVLDARRSRLRNEPFAALFSRKGVCAVVVRTTATTRDVVGEIAAAGLPTIVSTCPASATCTVTVVTRASQPFSTWSTWGTGGSRSA